MRLNKKEVIFSWTTPALVARRKSVTRRAWTPEYAARFVTGDEVLAINKPRKFGGRAVAVLRIDKEPYIEPLSEMPDEDYELEGFAYLNAHPELIPKSLHKSPLYPFDRRSFDRWRQSGGSLYVVRFNILKIYADETTVVRPAKPETYSLF